MTNSIENSNYQALCGANNTSWRVLANIGIKIMLGSIIQQAQFHSKLQTQCSLQSGASYKPLTIFYQIKKQQQKSNYKKRSLNLH